MKKLTLIITLLQVALFSFSQVAYVAHRGASYLAPENTKASINLAWELGADAAECDILITKDKQIILMHDKNIKRLTGVDMNVAESKYRELKKLSIFLTESNLPEYKNEKIPRLKDILKKLPANKTLVIEIKTNENDMLYELEKIINKYWKQGKIVFIDFNFDNIIKMKKMFPNLPCYFLSGREKQIEFLFEQIKSSKLDGVNLNHKIIDEKMMEKMKSINKKVGCWTVNEIDIAKRMINLNVEFITTDKPKWLKENTNKKEEADR